MSNPSNERRPQRPRIILKDCIAAGNGGDGFRFENSEASGENLVARDNGGDGIVVVDSKTDLDDPTTE